LFLLLANLGGFLIIHARVDAPIQSIVIQHIKALLKSFQLCLIAPLRLLTGGPFGHVAGHHFLVQPLQDRPGMTSWRNPAANCFSSVTSRVYGSGHLPVHCSETGTAHIILAVTDDGSPRLTSYRRIILNVHTATGQ